ncbi:MAG TPA: TPM domain-containing protein [Burkholderiaceae bacterium]|nr:TPM domain-containing protein [Burkholderiaceae bacterium]
MRHDGGKWKEWTGWAFVEGHWLRRKHFTKPFLDEVARRIAEGERAHPGELMLAIEAVSPGHERDTRLRALEVFGRLRVWDTPGNSGVLLYMALDRHSIELVADRGVPVPDDQWAQVCANLRTDLQFGRYTDGVLAAIDAIEAKLAEHCPRLPGVQGGGINALDDRPVLL